MRRFFYAINNDNTDAMPLPKLGDLPLGSHVELPESIVHHWCRVLRANIGDQGILFDGFGGEYKVELKAISKKNATATLLTHLKDDRTAPIISKIGLVMSRGERMDYAVQKATELGVSKIIPIISERTEVKDLNLDRANKITIEATEQSNQLNPPKINQMINLKNFINSISKETKLFFADINSKYALSSKDLEGIKNISILNIEAI